VYRSEEETCVPLAVRPEQWIASGLGHPSWRFIRSFYSALLINLLADMQAGFEDWRPKPIVRQRNLRKALQWIAYPDESDVPINFHTVCTVLGFDEQYLRDRLRNFFIELNGKMDKHDETGLPVAVCGLPGRPRRVACG